MGILRIENIELLGGRAGEPGQSWDCVFCQKFATLSLTSHKLGEGKMERNFREEKIRILLGHAAVGHLLLYSEFRQSRQLNSFISCSGRPEFPLTLCGLGSRSIKGKSGGFKNDCCYELW